jgi:hypothetical protein
MAKKTTKVPDGTTGIKLEYQEVNWGNAAQLFMTMIGNINQNLLDIKRDVEEIKKCRCQTTKQKT